MYICRCMYNMYVSIIAFLSIEAYFINFILHFPSLSPFIYAPVCLSDKELQDVWVNKLLKKVDGLEIIWEVSDGTW